MFCILRHHCSFSQHQAYDDIYWPWSITVNCHNQLSSYTFQNGWLLGVWILTFPSQQFTQILLFGVGIMIFQNGNVNLRFPGFTKKHHALHAENLCCLPCSGAYPQSSWICCNSPYFTGSGIFPFQSNPYKRSQGEYSQTVTLELSSREEISMKESVPSCEYSD